MTIDRPSTPSAACPAKGGPPWPRRLLPAAASPTPCCVHCNKTGCDFYDVTERRCITSQQIKYINVWTLAKVDTCTLDNMRNTSLRLVKLATSISQHHMFGCVLQDLYVVLLTHINL